MDNIIHLDQFSQIKNPYLDAVKDIVMTHGYAAQSARDPRTNEYKDLRGPLVKKYAWAIPCMAAVAAIQKAAPKGVVEIGAGSGYWAYLLRQVGVDVAPYDIKPYDNHWVKSTGDRWADVRVGGPEQAAAYSEQALMLCWAPYKDPMAEEALRAYRGNTLLWIGEDRYGCCGDQGFWDLLEEGWSEEEYTRLPVWDCIHDGLTIYRRK